MGVVVVMAALAGCEAPVGVDGEGARAAGAGPEVTPGPSPVTMASEPTAALVPTASRPVVTPGVGSRVGTPETRPATGSPPGAREAPAPARALTTLAESARRDVASRVESSRASGADDAGRAADLATCRAGTLVPEAETKPGLVEDCAALLEVWEDSIEGWALNWSAERPISEWDGVTLGGSPPRVHEIDLANRDLGGEIPPALGRLTALRRLSLFNNELSGPIPAELGDLQTLFRLNLAVNRLSGPIPPELGRLPLLTYLTLGSNRLSGSIPAELGHLSNLTFLDLTDNQLTGQVPVEFGRLFRLRGLFLANNQLIGRIPHELGTLPGLTKLELDGNGLTGESPRLREVIDIEISHPERLCNPGRSLGIWLWFWENQVRWHPDGSTVFFSQGPLVYAAAVDGWRVEQVADSIAPATTSWSSNDTLMTSFDLSPTGDRLVYATCAYRREPMGLYGYGHTYDIAVVDLARGSVQRLSDNETFENYPSWSPDGMRIAFLDDSAASRGGVRNTKLVVVGADGAGRQPVSTDGRSAVLHPPQWSPHGRQLAFVGTDRDSLDLTVDRLDADGANFRRLGRAASGPAWSPDGTRLAFVTTDEATGDDRILVTVAPDGTQMREVPLADDWTPGYEGVHSSLSWANWIPTLEWSPTGDQLLYTCGWRVCVVRSDGTPVGQSPIDWGYVGGVAAWSPDGGRIAVAPGAAEEFGSVVSRGPLLYTMAPDGSDMQVLVEAGIQAVASKAWRLSVAESRAACAAGYVVPEPEANPGLVRDCDVLLGLRDWLFGEEVSNWHSGTPIAHWVGVTVEGDVPRVTALELPQDRSISYPRRSIPSNLSALTHLQSLGLANGAFVGPIPRQLMDLRRLAHLDLSGNALTGPAPPELSRLANLSTLDLSRNALSGPIPAEVSQLANLRRLDLAGNEFEGPVPTGLGQLTTLEELSLSYNRLTGSIPPALGRLAQLRLLGLSGNQLTGSIPPELGRLAALRGLGLHTNQLTGPIPPELDGLTSLEWIRLTENDLTGCISPRLKFRLEQAGCLRAGV